MALLAEWIFSQSHVLSGGIDQPEMYLADSSGNGNTLERITANNPNALSKPAMFWENNALHFYNRQAIGGYYFSTVAGAPINDETFASGYTIEAAVKIPKPGEFDPWMGILTRQGSAAMLGCTDGEKEIICNLCFNDSFQYTWYPLGENQNYTCWSCCYDDLDFSDFVHICIRNDGKKTTLYLNGEKDIRNPSGKSFKGIACVNEMGWNIGAAFWNNKLSGMFSGAIRYIKIYDCDYDPMVHVDDLIYHKTLYPLLGSQAGGPLIKPGNESLVVIPDSQYMGQYAPEIVEKMFSWTAEQKNILNIKAMLHVGDISEETAPVEFERAVCQLAPVQKAGIPYLITPGNHDYCQGNGGDTFKNFFGELHYQYNCSVVFAEDSCSAVLPLTLGGRECLLVSLDSYSPANAIPWVKRQIEQRNCPAILLTHDVYEPIPEDRTSKEIVRSKLGQRLWRELIQDSREIFMVIGGHHFGVGHGTAQNAGGLVTEMLINYQTFPKGGNGWLCVLDMDFAEKEVHVHTYSPWVEEIPIAQRGKYDLAYLTSERDVYTLPIRWKCE